MLFIKCVYNTRYISKNVKCADVSPIYKKGNNMDVGNYRPVCVLPIMSKVFEKVIINQMTSCFDRIFHPCVSGLEKVILVVKQYW